GGDDGGSRDDDRGDRRARRDRRCLLTRLGETALTRDMTRPPHPTGCGGPVQALALRSSGRTVSDCADGLSLRSLGALGDLELDPLGLLEGLVAVALNGGVVDEHVRATAIL